MRGEGKMGDGLWGEHLLGGAVGVVCKWWIMGIYSWSQDYTVYTLYVSQLDNKLYLKKNQPTCIYWGASITVPSTGKYSEVK